MTVRYFVSTDSEHKPIALYRFDRAIHEERCWNGSEWVDSEKPTRFLMLGEGWLEEIEEEGARKLFPQAFHDPADFYDRAEFHRKYWKSVKDGSLEKSTWSVTLSNGEDIEYYQIDGEGHVSDFQVMSYLDPNSNDLGDGAPEEDKYIQFSHFGRYPKDINDPVSVMLAIWKVHNQLTPFKYSGNYPDISRYTTLPDGMVE